MNNNEILNKAIKKAIANGLPMLKDDRDIYLTESLDVSFLSENNWYANKEKIIFSHDFAKAFWKNDFDCNHVSELWSTEIGNAYFDGEDWQFHLQQMVLEKDPIKYLEQFLGGDK